MVVHHHDHLYVSVSNSLSALNCIAQFPWAAFVWMVPARARGRWHVAACCRALFSSSARVHLHLTPQLNISTLLVQVLLNAQGPYVNIDVVMCPVDVLYIQPIYVLALPRVHRQYNACTMYVGPWIAVL